MSKKERNMNLDPRIRSYLSGSMSPEERNRFEKEMQKDPFLADAVEGFSNVTPLEADHDLKTIRSKIFQGRTKKSFTIYRIAAAVIVLIGVSSILLLKQINEPEMLSEQVNIEQDTLPVLTNPVGDITEQEEAARENIIEKDVQEIHDRNVGEPAKKLEEAAQEEVAMLEEEVFQDISDFDKAVKPDTAGILDFRVAGVSLEEEEQKLEEALVTEVAKSARKKDAVRAIALQPEVSKQVEAEFDLDEMVGVHDTMQVVEVLALKGGEEDISGSYQRSGPEGGITAYRKYIKENIVFPEEWTRSDREVVRMEFTVRVDGSIGAFEIIRSPDSLFSGEAIRLIKEGPTWIPARQNDTFIEDKSSLRIVFKR